MILRITQNYLFLNIIYKKLINFCRSLWMKEKMQSGTRKKYLKKYYILNELVNYIKNIPNCQ